MRLEDALFNWLQIKNVAEARPEDISAKNTVDFFGEILREDYKLNNIRMESLGDDLLQVWYDLDGITHKKSFDREMTEQLLHDINANPRYNE
ncbi:MAG: hypothetical protein WDZ91_10900 [Paenibacillaceae bacterium]